MGILVTMNPSLDDIIIPRGSWWAIKRVGPPPLFFFFFFFFKKKKGALRENIKSVSLFDGLRFSYPGNFVFE